MTNRTKIQAEPFAWLAGPDSALPPSQNWVPLPAGETHWYAFDYQGHLEAGRGKKKGETVWIGSQIHVLLDAEPDSGAAFSIWTPAQVRSWALGEEVEPVGRGTRNELEPGDLFWSGNFAGPDRFFIVVEHRGSEPSRLKLSIRSKGVFVPTVRQTAQNLQDEGYGAVAIGEALRVLGQDAQAAGQTLKDLAFPAIGVGQALKDAFGLDALAAAQVLKDVGFSAEETAVALRDPNGYDIQDATLVATALKDVFGLDATFAAQVLKNAGFSAEETAIALQDPNGYNIQLAKGISVHIGLNSVDPQHYSGWSGPLNACEADAQDMQQIAENSGFETTILLTNQATRSAVKTAIESAATRLGAGDFLFVTYSGHGGQVPDYSGDEPDRQDETWCLYDGQLLDDELYVLWSKFAEDVRILVLSDSCHSGTVTRALRENPQLVNLALGTPRFMPAEEALKTYRANRQFYDELSRSMPAEINVQASGLLISGCQDDQLSYDGAFNGAFTGQLLSVWDGGAFEGDYVAFHQAIKAGLTDQTPNLFKYGVEDESFTQEKPFQI